MPTSSEIASIRLFLKKGLIFVVPFLVYAALLVVLDPFNYFNVAHVIGDEYKLNSAGELHQPLWKSLIFLREPKPNIFLGDSRMALFPASAAEELTQEPYFNFSFGGGTIPEMVDTFWLANERVELRRVFIGISLINFNKFQSMNRVLDSNAILDSALLYLTDRLVSKAALYAAYAQVRGKQPEIGKPLLDPEAFWRYQLGGPTTALLSRFRYPDEYLERLREVAEHCAGKGIELAFVIPPSHVDLQEKIPEFGMVETAERFGRDLRSLGRVIDFDFPNEFTRDRANFSDPYHFIRGTSFLVEAILAETPDPAIARP